MDLTATREALLDLLDAGELLLLPNPHAARALRHAHDSRQRARNLPAWQPARAITWQQWTASLHTELIVTGAESRLLLNPAQEHTLWREIIANDPPPDALASLDSLAELAASAYALAAAYNAVPRLRAAATSEDTRTFARWAEAFDARCQRERCLSAATLDAALAAAAALIAPHTLRLVAFPHLTPSQQQLADALAQRGTRITDLQPTSTATPAHQQTILPTPHDELTYAAHWLRTALQGQPTQRIAVLVPGLESERTAVETILRNTLTTELQSIATDLSSTPWEFSIGEPLTTLPLIADALDLIHWTIAPLPQPRISALLLSPYLNPGTAREHAAQLDYKLRRPSPANARRLRPELSLDAFLRLLDQHASGLAWPRQLALELQRVGDLTRPRTYAQWMELARSLVQATGWPSSQTRALTANEFAATRAWDSALDTVATLDFAGRRVTLFAALEALDRQIRSTAFQPPTTHAAIQILRPDQAEGTLFDAVLYLHATGQNLPAAERPHPLLSLALQSQLHMPGTNAAETSRRAHTAIAALLQRTPTALFLSAHEDENGTLRPSPLLSGFHLSQISPDPALTPAQPAPVPLETTPDNAPLPPLPSHRVAGGARVLQLQAACGFRAFAELRLGAVEPESADIGLDVRDSGTLVHKILQLLWAPVDDVPRTQQQLAALSPQDRQAQLAQYVDHAFRLTSALPQDQWDAAYLSLIRERLLSVLTQWVDLELQRSPFTVIAVEKKHEVPIGPLLLEVRVDRLDSVATTDHLGNPARGSVLIDYKTGISAHPRQWDAPRPEEPQLPLYTVLFGMEAAAEIKAIAFAKLVAGENMRWHGLQAEDGHLPGHKITGLPERLAEWREELERLATAFAQGEASVDPKDFPKTCDRCSLHLLCRVGELHLADDIEAAEDGDE